MNFHATLIRMGNFRLGISKKFSGVPLLIVGMFALIFYLTYWVMIGVLWMMYGFLWITFVLPFRFIMYLNRDRNDAVLEANNVPKILRSDAVFWLSVVLLPPLAIFILFLREDKKLINRILCGLCVFPFALAWIMLVMEFFK